MRKRPSGVESMENEAGYGREREKDERTGGRERGSRG